MTPITTTITHPHALTAVLLASFNRVDRPYVTETLALSGTPRSLYTLARVLRAAQIVDEINAAHPALVVLQCPLRFLP